MPCQETKAADQKAVSVHAIIGFKMSGVVTLPGHPVMRSKGSEPQAVTEPMTCRTPMPAGLPTHHVVAAALTWPVFVSAPVFSSRTILSIAGTGP